MNEVVTQYVGKECIVNCGSSQIAGVVESVEGHWIVLMGKCGRELVNLDYVSRIREYPLTKTGKKKSIVLD